MSVLTKQLSMPKLSKPRLSKPSAPQLRAPRRAAAVTGLEIGATRVIAARASVHDGRVVAERVVARRLPHGLMRDGLVTEPERLAAELKALFTEHNLDKRVRVGLATPRTILRVIDLPPLDDKDVRAALMMQAQERIPMPLERAVLDFQTVGVVETPEGRRLRTIVVVSEREGVERLLETLQRAGLRPAGVDLSIFAVMRALGPLPEAGPTLYAQVGDLVNIAIAEDRRCHFTRQAPQGLALILDRLAELRAIPVEEAFELLHDATADGAGHDPDVDAILSRAASELGSELRAAAEFYGTQVGNEPVTRGVVTGPLVVVPGLVTALARSSGLELSTGEVPIAGADALGDVDARIAPVAAGLAIAEVKS